MAHSSLIDSLRLIGIPGTNKVMMGEFSRLVRRAFNDIRLEPPKKEGQGALVYPFDPRTAALAVQYHRTSSRVLWGLYESSAARLEPLYDDLIGAIKADERGWFEGISTFSVAVANVERFAAGGRQVVGTVKNAIVEGLESKGVGLTVDPEDPDLRIDVRMHDERIVVSIDLAGRPMNQRGYRTERGIAPLRENLAAVLVMLARYDSRSEPLVDMMAGSGTIAIEAALMARGEPVWVPPRRPLAFRMPLMAEHLSTRPEPLFGDAQPMIISNEMDRHTVKVAMSNMVNAGVNDVTENFSYDFRELLPAELIERSIKRGFPEDRGLLLSNPPYGERLKPDELLDLYAEMGDWCRQFKGWRACFLMANPDFTRAFGGKPRIKKPLKNGPLMSWFLQYEL
jgi:23S rRNA G2445 N2-methylase RlmL